MVEVFAVKLNRERKECEYEKLLRLVSQGKKDRIQRFHRYKDSQMYLLADILIRKIIINKYNVDNQEFTNIKLYNYVPQIVSGLKKVDRTCCYH